MPTKDTNSSFEITIDELKQYTQYAYYVTTQAVNRENEAFVLNVTQGVSEMAYFQMPADIPTAPKVETISKTHNSITLEWYPQVPDPELITYYTVDIFIQPDDHQFLETRNFCEHPRENIPEIKTVQVGQVNKSQYPSKTRKCTLWELATELGLTGNNITESERSEALHQHRVNCLLMYERNRFELFVSSHLGDHEDEDSDCQVGNKTCDDQNSSRFKRELESLVEYDDNVSRWSDSSAIQKQSIFTNHIGNMTFMKDEQSGTISDLKPFTLYTIHFFSCNNVTNCSPYYLHSERTAMLPEADNMTFAAKMDDANTTVHLEFDEPERPNGLTVAYVIEQHDFTNANIIETCLSRKQHKLNRNRYEHFYFGLL